MKLYSALREEETCTPFWKDPTISGPLASNPDPAALQDAFPGLDPQGSLLLPLRTVCYLNCSPWRILPVAKHIQMRP